MRRSILLLSLVAGLGCQPDDSPTGPAAADPARPAAASAAVVDAGFIQASADGFSSCAVATDHRAYCWGSNTSGELGDGTAAGHLISPAGSQRGALSTGGEQQPSGLRDHHRQLGLLLGRWRGGRRHDGNRLVPVPVAGGLHFFQLDVGTEQTCAVSDPDRRLYCWDSARLTPTRLGGDLRFRMVSGGQDHFCGVTTTDQAYCWGWNRFGQLGDGGDNGVRPQPVPVASKHAFRQIDAGFQHTCAVTTDHQVFCWGYGELGQLGDGSTTIRRRIPRRVQTSVRFDRVSAGGGQSCASPAATRPTVGGVTRTAAWVTAPSGCG